MAGLSISAAYPWRGILKCVTRHRLTRQPSFVVTDAHLQHTQQLLHVRPLRLQQFIHHVAATRQNRTFRHYGIAAFSTKAPRMTFDPPPLTAEALPGFPPPLTEKHARCHRYVWESPPVRAHILM